MKIISWNVNGLRACINKGFNEFFEKVDADIFAIQEIKLQEDQLDLNKEGYHYYINSAIKKGYSGCLVYSKKLPIEVTYGINDLYNDEGRLITLEFEEFYFVCCYVPNSQEGLKRIEYRLEFEKNLSNYLEELDHLKPVIYCGDLNVAHERIDLKNPDSNSMNPGFSPMERLAFSELLNRGFIDTFRYLYPNKIEYSWWSYRFSSRDKNIGWRIDYFVISNRLKDLIKDSLIHTSVLGSDHAPIELDIKDPYELD